MIHFSNASGMYTRLVVRYRLSSPSIPDISPSLDLKIACEQTIRHRAEEISGGVAGHSFPSFNDRASNCLVYSGQYCILLNLLDNHLQANNSHLCQGTTMAIK
jgi:hypothetical protein